MIMPNEAERGRHRASSKRKLFSLEDLARPLSCLANTTSCMNVFIFCLTTFPCLLGLLFCPSAPCPPCFLVWLVVSRVPLPFRSASGERRHSSSRKGDHRDRDRDRHGSSRGDRRDRDRDRDRRSSRRSRRRDRGSGRCEPTSHLVDVCGVVGSWWLWWSW